MDETGTANTSITVPGTGTSIELSDLRASIAAELASELSTPEDIRKRYGFTKIQWDKLKANPVFRGMVADSIKSFRGPLQAGARITKKAEIMLEDSLADLFLIAKDNTIPSGERIKAVQTMAELAGRGKGGASVADPNAPKVQGFTLNINIGDGKTVSIQGSSDAGNE